MRREAVNLPGLEPGFADPVHGAQRTFRTVLDAFARPGRLARVTEPASPPRGLGRAAAAAVLALADADTPLWLEGAAGAAADWFRFHCGSPLAPHPQGAAFAIVSGASLRLDAFAAGEPEQPERSATVIAEVRDLRREGAWRLSGPGVNGEARVGVDGLPLGFLEDWGRNAAAFPCGVDLLLTAGDLALGLPRTVRIEA
jgi:alpha-D-ribose 1-methylphosphonate 5-triphosphate synthase subunit PhnH